jgi:hypothetical protein
MAMEEDDNFCARERIRGFFLEDADDVIVLWARNGQRRRRHRRPSLCPRSLHKTKGTEFRFCWGKGGAGWGKCVRMVGLRSPVCQEKLVVGRGSRLPADQNSGPSEQFGSMSRHHLKTRRTEEQKRINRFSINREPKLSTLYPIKKTFFPAG